MHGSQYPFGPRWSSGDFNGDGRTDLAVDFNDLDSYENRVEVLLGDGDGSFRAGPIVAVAGSQEDQTALVAGDFNGDGRTDLAVALPASPLVIELSRGDGTFSTPETTPLAIHSTPRVADLDGDGVADVIVVDQQGDILWRRGQPGQSGGYQPPVTINTSDPSVDFAIVPTDRGDLVAGVDASDDLVTLYAYRDGAFVVLDKLRTGLQPAQIITSDLTGDSTTDLVVRNAGDGTASIFVGDRDGNFAKQPDVVIGVGASDIKAADVDGSGRDSLIVTNQVTGDGRILPSLGNGSFGPPSRYQAGGGPYGLAAGSDGTVDLTSEEATAGSALGTFIAGAPPSLVTLDPGSNTIAVLDGLGGGAFANPRTLDTTSPQKAVVVADFNGDGIDDLATLGQDGVTILLGDGRGGFTASTPIDVGPFATGLSVADLDGKPDLLVGNTFGDVLVLIGNGDGTFQPYRKTDQGIALAVADLNGTGRKDFIYANAGLDRVTVEYGGAEQQLTGLLAPGAVSLVKVGDGVTDLVVANSGSNNVLVYPGLGDGQFGPALNGGNGFFTGTNPVGVTVADLNGDGVPDLVVANKGSNDVSILLGQGTGLNWTLQPAERLKAGFGPTAMVVADVFHDGKPDILVSDSGSNDVRLLPGVGGGFFNDTNPTIFNTGLDPGPLFVGDFTGRPGQLDLVTLNAGSNDLSLFENIGDGDTSARSISSGGLDPVAGVMGDLAGDGTNDLLVANNGDGHLALFLGGPGGLDLAKVFEDAGLPQPTSLAMDGSGAIYGSSAGNELAVQVTLGLGVAGTPSPLPSAPVEQQIAALQPLDETSLALVATLLTVTVETHSEVAALPNQGPLPAGVERPDLDGEQEGAPAAPALFQAIPAQIARFLAGLDERFAQARIKARQGSLFGETSTATDNARRAAEFEQLMGRWSPVISAFGGSLPAVAVGLARPCVDAVRAVESATRRSAIERRGAEASTPSAAGPEAAAERESLAAGHMGVTMVGYVAVIKTLTDLIPRPPPDVVVGNVPDRRHRKQRASLTSPTTSSCRPRPRKPRPLGRAKGVIRKGRAAGIALKFVEATGEGLKTDIKILCLVRVRIARLLARERIGLDTQADLIETGARAAIRHGIGEPGDQRGFGARHHEVDRRLPRKPDQTRDVERADRHVLRQRRRARVAGGGIDLGRQRRGRDRPDQRVFAPAAAHYQNPHHDPASTGAASSIGSAHVRSRRLPSPRRRRGKRSRI